MGRLFAENKANLRPAGANVPLTISMLGWPKISLPDRLCREIGLSPCRFIWNGLTGCHRRRLLPTTVRSIIEHLGRMTLGDAVLEHEVLAMFSAQTVSLIGIARQLAAGSRRTGAYAEGVGACDRRLRGGRCRRGRLETAIRNGDDPARALAELDGCRDAGALRHRRDPAPILISQSPWGHKSPCQTAPQVFAPAAGAERIDPL